MDVAEGDSTSSYNLRTRTVVKHPLKAYSQTNPYISKSLLLGRSDSNFQTEKPEVNQEKEGDDDDDDEKDRSQESVSMLHELYQNSKNEFPELIDTCLDSELEVVSIYTDDEPDDEETVLKDEKATQTNFETFELSEPREMEIARNANFIKSVVKLKALLSSKEPASPEQTWITLENTMKGEKLTGEFFKDLKARESVPKETIGYLVRASNMENVFEETVASLLQHFDGAFKGDFGQMAYCWKNSAYEMAVEMLCEAVDSEVGIWKMVDSFLCENIASVLKDAGKSKNSVLESKTNIITCFCQSTHLSYTAVNFIIKKLEKLKTIKQNCGSLTEKVSWTYLTKNSYFLLRLLETSLNLLKSKVFEGKVEEVVFKNSEQKNYNVLEMWKKHWNKNVDSKEKKTTHEWEVVVSRWCADLDEVLMHCVNHIPLLSTAVERCGMLAKEILRLCHKGSIETKKAISSDKLKINNSSKLN